MVRRTPAYSLPSLPDPFPPSPPHTHTQDLGGIGLTNTGYARLTEIIGGNDLGLGIHLGAHQSIGFKGILLFGTPEQKAKYLPDLAAGKKVAAFALTEPSTGSDANSVRTRAKLGADGKWYLSGSKLWISNGGLAEVFTVFAQTEVPDPKVPGGKRDKVTAFVVERKFGGVTNGPPEKKMGIKCSNTAEVYFDNTPIPPENVLGEVGGGFKVAMEILNNGRFGMGAALTGTMKAVIKGVTEHANSRVQFGKTIREYGNIKNKIASMAARTYAAESMAYMLAANMDRGMKDYMIEAAISKVFASEAAWFVADTGIQIMGGLGYMQSLPYERFLRDIRIFLIFEGENTILRYLIAGSGLQSLGKELEPVTRALKSPLTNLPLLAPFGLTLAKSRLGIVDSPKLGWAPQQLAHSAAIVESATGHLGDVSRALLMRYGKTVIDQQLVLEKVADVAIDVTASTAVLSRAAKALKEGSPSAAHEAELANLFVSEAGQRIRANLAAARGRNGQPAINKLKYTVADAVMSAGGYHAKPPVGF
jgi:very long chain acyl-CoA dehydrogenase